MRAGTDLKMKIKNFPIFSGKCVFPSDITIVTNEGGMNMTNERNEILQSAEIKHLMHTFFTVAAPLFACRPSAARDGLSQQMLELVLSVCHGQQHAET